MISKNYDTGIDFFVKTEMVFQICYREDQGTWGVLLFNSTETYQEDLNTYCFRAILKRSIFLKEFFSKSRNFKMMTARDILQILLL